MIRLARINDKDQIIDIYKHINEDAMKSSLKYNEYDFIEHIKTGNIYVYDTNDIINGFVLFYDHITWAYIEILCVGKPYRNNGIGKELLESVKNNKWGIIEVCCHLNDIDSIRFVENNNYTKSDQITIWYYKRC